MNTTYIDINSLYLDKREIFSAIGIPNQVQDELTQSLVDSVELEMTSIIKPQFNFVVTEKVDFKCGTIISDALKNADKYAIIIATIGKEADSWLKKLMSENIVKMYVADIVLSEVVEATMRKALDKIRSEVATDMNIGNSYSPGYCGWSLREQSKLFAMFKGDTCGVTLNESFLMSPIKSVSAVVPIGKKITKQPYGCVICTKENCYKRKKM